MSDTTSRQYSSPLRERHAQQTRDLILDAVTDLLESHRIDEVTRARSRIRRGCRNGPSIGTSPIVMRSFAG